jgi:hypothetical protein
VVRWCDEAVGWGQRGGVNVSQEEDATEEESSGKDDEQRRTEERNLRTMVRMKK